MSLDWPALVEATLQHLKLTTIAVGVAVLIGVPLGAYLVRQRFLSGPTLAVLGVLQTVPSLALLGLLVPIYGIGEKPALIALYLYALLPIVRNTVSGLSSIDASVLDAARGLGMRERDVLVRVSLPLALPVVMAGVRTSAVINVGVATLAALVGAGGLGDFIFRGISMVNYELVLLGAIPAALLALLIDVMLGLLERWLRPRGAGAGAA